MSKKRNNKNNKQNTSLTLKNIAPLTPKQEAAFINFEEGKNLILHGMPGTGKTFVGLYLALEELQNNPEIHKVVIIRSPVQGRNQGFMKGSIDEKMMHYEAPYRKICSELYGRDDAYDVLKKKGMIEFMSTSFVRGITLSNSIIVMDEVQNYSFQELHTCITRFGRYSRLIMCGDIKQDDLTSERFNEFSGLQKLISVLLLMSKSIIKKVEFLAEDIVRDDFVKDYIIALDRYEQEHRLSA